MVIELFGDKGPNTTDLAGWPSSDESRLYCQALLDRQPVEVPEVLGGAVVAQEVLAVDSWRALWKVLEGVQEAAGDSPYSLEERTAGSQQNGPEYWCKDFQVEE